MNTKTCQQCNIEYHKPYTCCKTEWNNRKFCSKKCGYDNRNIGKKIHQCLGCKKVFSGRYGKPEYCSMVCKNKAPRGGIITEKCVSCLKEYTHKRSVPRLYCSQKCISRKGEKSHFWKGGISPILTLLRQTEEYNNWRKAVYARDYWTCQDCGVKQKNPVAHHIKSFKNYPALRHEISNGITLCRSCHKKTHSEIGVATRFEKKFA